MSWWVKPNIYILCSFSVAYEISKQGAKKKRSRAVVCDGYLVENHKEREVFVLLKFRLECILKK